jgi:hypothetical protein
MEYAQLKLSEWTALQNQFTMYQMSAILLFCMIIGIVFLFRPAFPFIISRFWSHDTVVGLLDNNKNIKLMNGFKLVNGIWYYKNKPLWFVKKYPGNYYFAGIPFEVIAFDLRLLNNPAYTKLVNDMRKLGYPDMTALENAILFSQMQEGDPRLDEMMHRMGIKSYGDAKKRINPANLTMKDPLVKPFFSAITLNELMGYGADIPAENILGEVDDIFESHKPSLLAMKKMREILPYCIIIVALAAAAVVVYKIFMK